MRLIKAAVLAVIITVMSSGNVLAPETFVTGNKLLEDCRKTTQEDAIGWGFCLGYLVGIADVMEGESLRGFRACLPAGVTKGQIRDVVKAWLESHPELRHHNAPGLVSHALSEAFPCKE